MEKVRERVPISIEVAMTEIDALNKGVTKLLEAVARLEENAEYRKEQENAHAARLSLLDTRLLHVERTTSDARAAMLILKWLFATSVAVGGLAIALLSMYH